MPRLLFAAILAAALCAQSGKPLAPTRQAPLLRTLAEDPNARDVPTLIERAFQATDPARAIELAAAISQRFTKASPIARAEADRAIAHGLLSLHQGTADSEAYARRALAELS